MFGSCVTIEFWLVSLVLCRLTAWIGKDRKRKRFGKVHVDIIIIPDLSLGKKTR